MNDMRKHDVLNSSLMTSEEMNFILLEPSQEEMSSPQLKNNLRSEMVKLLKHDLTGVLLLPFTKKDL
jgi:hypothetical protein